MIIPVVLRWFVHSSVQMLKFSWLAVVDQRCLSKCTWKAASWCTPFIHSWHLIWKLKTEPLKRGINRLWLTYDLSFNMVTFGGVLQPFKRLWLKIDRKICRFLWDPNWEPEGNRGFNLKGDRNPHCRISMRLSSWQELDKYCCLS